ncbi:MAG: 3-hydroxybutyrate dehydrogenase [Archangium sp.]|nr:3-hydroxybutyrate dehydrogenase [Archangium sp.]MDP3572489.1 3-hydroxybutyrate dehydrogenase [Archangium sp.]
MKTLEKKRALVTGAASGIGLAIVHEFHAQGMQVIASDMSATRLAEVYGALPAVRCLAADLSKQDAVAQLAREAGPLDVLVNNAGLQHVSPIEKFEQAKWDLLIQVMLTAPFQLIQAVLPGMYERSWGRIINVSSVHGLIASPFKSAYVSAKHGMMGLTKVVALEAGARSRNITCNAICPSYVRTPLVEKQLADQSKAHGIPENEVLEKVLLTQNAIKRLIEPEEVAQLATFLCGEGAWSITGTAQQMDAGWLAH